MSRPAGRVAVRLGERALGLAAAATLLLVVLASLLRPVVPWDSWAYHLPFSALLWDIGDARRTFLLGEHLSTRFAGFPLFAEFLQGALWKATGSMAASTLVNSVALAALVAVVGIALRGSLPIMTFGCLSIPLVAFHSTSNYIDLFVAVVICLHTKGPSFIKEYEGSTKLRVPLPLSFIPSARHTTLKPYPEPMTRLCFDCSALTRP